jgi:hypothetical protein
MNRITRTGEFRCAASERKTFPENLEPDDGTENESNSLIMNEEMK